MRQPFPHSGDVVAHCVVLLGMHDNALLCTRSTTYYLILLSPLPPRPLSFSPEAIGLSGKSLTIHGRRVNGGNDDSDLKYTTLGMRSFFKITASFSVHSYHNHPLILIPVVSPLVHVPPSIFLGLRLAENTRFRFKPSLHVFHPFACVCCTHFMLPPHFARFCSIRGANVMKYHNLVDRCVRSHEFVLWCISGCFW